MYYFVLSYNFGSKYKYGDLMKISKYCYICFNIFLICGINSLYASNIIMRNFPYNGYIIPLLLLPFVLLLTTILFNNLESLKLVINNRFIRILFLLYLILSAYILIINYLKITNDYFYNITPPLIVLIIILFLSLFISSYGINNIINVGFIFSILIFSIGLILFIMNPTNNNINNNYQFNDYYLLIGNLFIYLDILLLPPFCSYKASKKDIYIILTISTIINTLLILKNYLLFDSSFFIDHKYPYISKFLFISINNYFEHFDLYYLIIITIFIIFKLSINIEEYRILCKIKKNSILNIIFILILISIISLSSYLNISLFVINILMIITSCILIMSLVSIKIISWRNYEKRNH